MGAVFRRVIAGFLLGPALLLGSLAWWGFLAQRTVFDESRTQTIAEELLDNEAVVDQIGENTGRALEAAMPESVDLTEAQVDAGADIILSDPVVRELLIGALVSSHRAFLGLEAAPASVDLGPALVSARDRIAVFAPTVAEQVPEELEVELPTERIPDASPVKSFVDRAVPLLALLSGVMVLVAFLTTRDRSSVLGRAARWAIGTTAVYLVAGLGVPYLLRELAPDQAAVVAALLSAVLRSAVMPSIVLGGVGAVLLVLSMMSRESGGVAEPRGRDVRRAPMVAPQRRAQPTAPHAPVSPGGGAPGGDQTTAIPAVSVPLPEPVLIPIPGAAPLSAMAPPPANPPVAAVHDLGPTALRPTLPTRAKPSEQLGSSPWTVGPLGEPSAPPAGDPANEKPRWLQPTWVAGHGWVMDPDDPHTPPNNARLVEGVGWVVPGPPPVS